MDSTTRPTELIYNSSENYEDKLVASSSMQRTNVLSNRLTSVLSASYADSEIRDALRQLDTTNIQNTPEIRRKIRLDVQKEVIDCNASVINDFGMVAEVRPLACRLRLHAEHSSAIKTDWINYREPEGML